VREWEGAGGKEKKARVDPMIAPSRRQTCGQTKDT